MTEGAPPATVEQPAPSGSPAVPYQAEITAATDRGDKAEAQRLYELQQGVTRLPSGRVVLGEPAEAAAVADAPGLPVLSAENAEGYVTGFEKQAGREAVEELRARWPGQEMARNFGAVNWLDDRYSLPATESEPQFLAAGVQLARQVFHELHPGGTAPSALSRERVDEFLRGYEPSEAEVIRRSQGGDLAQNLAYAGWLLRTYCPGADLSSEVGLLRAKAAIARGIHADLQAARQTPQRRETPMTDNPAIENDVSTWSDDDYDDALEALREESQKYKFSNPKRARRAYLQEQALITRRQGNQPIVGLRGRLV